MVLADLHVHSNFSDGEMTIPQLVDFYGTRGFGAVAITDHICEESGILGRCAHLLRYTLTPEKFATYQKVIAQETKRAWEQYCLVLIPGFEVTRNSLSSNRSAHLLGLGVNEFVSADQDVEAICQSIRSQGALVVAAHPVSTRKMESQTYYLWNRRRELAPLIDAWEVASGPHFFEEVFASQLRLVASSDLHRPRQINSWKTILHCRRDRDAILNAILEQTVSFQFYLDRAGSEAAAPAMPVVSKPISWSMAAAQSGRKFSFQ